MLYLKSLFLIFFLHSFWTNIDVEVIPIVSHAICKKFPLFFIAAVQFASLLFYLIYHINNNFMTCWSIIISSGLYAERLFKCIIHQRARSENFFNKEIVSEMIIKCSSFTMPCKCFNTLSFFQFPHNCSSHT